VTSVITWVTMVRKTHTGLATCRIADAVSIAIGTATLSSEGA